MKLKITWSAGVCLAIVVAQAALGLSIVGFGPAGPIPIHFNLSGEANGWGDRALVGGVVGGMAALSALAVWGIGALSRRAGPGAPAAATPLTTARTMVLFATTMICGLLAASTFGRLGAGETSSRLLMGFLCLMFVGIGAWLGKVGPNAMVGVRTPWNFASRLAWDKSNRLAGRLFLWGGFAGAVAAPFVPQPGGLRVTILGVLAIAAASVVESWRVWRRDPDRISAL